MLRNVPVPRWWLLVSAISLGAVALALVSQHVYDMQPCPWCVLQRLIFTAIGLVAVLGVFWRGAAATWATALTVGLLASAGMAAALWQHFVAAATASCNQTLADKIINGLGLDGLLPDVFEPRASCADAAVKLLGLPYEVWSLALFVLIDLMAAWLLVSRLRRPA